MTSRVLVLLMLGVMLALPDCGRHQAPGPAAPTFSRDVAPIVFEHCAPCHRSGEAGPFSLLTYEDVRRRATQIADVTGRRYMPPWMPEPGHGEFEGTRRLTDAQIGVLRSWADGGAPEGDARDLPATPTWTSGWQLGRPDLVIDVPKPFRMDAGGRDVFRTFIVPLPVNQLRWVRAVEFRPGNARAVHHAILRIARGRLVTEGDKDGEADSSGMLATEEAIASPDGHLIGWAPGYSPNVSPPDMAWGLEPGTALAIELHLQPTGKPEDVQPSVGLFFTDRSPDRTPFGLQLGSYTIDIPPGDAHYVIDDRYTLPVDVQVLAIYPHAHYRGKDIRAWAILPDGTERPLIWIKDWDFNWQNAYRYKEPVALPRGTTIAMRYAYDNSAANPRNPVQPPARVHYGGQSSDEMGNLWLQVVPARGTDLAMLRFDYAMKSTERQVEGYEHLLKLRPGDPTIRRALADAHNFIGVTLRQQGRAAEAVESFRRAIATFAAHPAAHSNLGSILRAAGRAGEAEREYRTALTIDPAYADAHYNLGVLLQATGRAADAARHLRRAIEIDPGAPQPYNALAWLIATSETSDPASRREAITLAERAVELTGRQDGSALDTLAAAYAAAGDLGRAIAVAERAASVAAAAGDAGLAAEIQQRLRAYRERGVKK